MSPVTENSVVSPGVFVQFRLAKLSEGQLIDGRLECLYHGWQFEGEGKCVKIPQVGNAPPVILS